MSHITFCAQASQNEIEITIGELDHRQAEAFLLGKSGEELYRFPLQEGNNKLLLHQFDAGTYSVRIDTGNEVVVKQITLFKLNTFNQP